MIPAPPDRLWLAPIATPLGHLLSVTDERDVMRGLWFSADDAAAACRQALRRQYPAVPVEPGAAPDSVLFALDRYFAGEIAALGDIPRAAAGTPFQRTVWAALTEIPAGTTMSYGALAATIGSPRAGRAVGAANGANPIAIVVPCHRLIGANRALTGYGGGIDRKRWLLRHEGAL